MLFCVGLRRTQTEVYATSYYSAIARAGVCINEIVNRKPFLFPRSIPRVIGTEVELGL
jgi:hypothetical protein